MFNMSTTSSALHWPLWAYRSHIACVQSFGVQRISEDTQDDLHILPSIQDAPRQGTEAALQLFLKFGHITRWYCLLHQIFVFKCGSITFVLCDSELFPICTSNFRGEQVNIFSSKLELIAEGRMVEAARIKLSTDDEEGPGINLSDDDVDTVLDKTVVTRSGNRRTLWTSTQLAAARQVITKFKDEMPKNKCENCLGHVPTIKQAGVGKIFQVS